LTDVAIEERTEAPSESDVLGVPRALDPSLYTDPPVRIRADLAEGLG
jgi:hypothetical protein